MADDNVVDNPLTNSCRIFTTGHCNLEEQLDEARAKINRLEEENKTMYSFLVKMTSDTNVDSVMNTYNDINSFLNQKAMEQ